MGIKKWDPLKDILLLQERMGRIFDEALLKYKGCPVTGAAWFPPVDIYETEEQVILKAELPGVDIKDIQVEVKESTIVLKGERRHAKNRPHESYHRMERFYGTFYRAFSLPYRVDEGGITAEITDGVLRISVPKVEEISPNAVRVPVE